MIDQSPRVRISRSYRFSGIVSAEAAIWELTFAVEGTPDPQSGMVVGLPSIDQLLQAAAEDLVKGTELAEVLLTVAATLKASGQLFFSAQMTLDDGLHRRCAAI